MKYFWYLWMVLITPNCWIRSHITDKKWDITLNIMLDNPTFKDVKYYSSSLMISLNDTLIWLGNYPYGYGIMNNEFLDECSGLPSRITVFRLREVVKNFEDSGGIKMNRNGANT